MPWSWCSPDRNKSGKTTLARELVSEDSANYFDLEDPVSLARLDEPMTALRALKGLIVIDEVQRRPDLFPVLRVLDTDKTLFGHPKVGASWEGFAIEPVLASEPHDEAWFWATHQGAEIDLVLRRSDGLLGVECKRADAPRMTPSIRTALEELGLERIAVLYPGAKRYPIADRVEAVPLETLAEPGRLFQESGA